VESSETSSFPEVSFREGCSVVESEHLAHACRPSTGRWRQEDFEAILGYCLKNQNRTKYREEKKKANTLS
jgi:hypothetical protein